MKKIDIIYKTGVLNYQYLCTTSAKICKEAKERFVKFLPQEGKYYAKKLGVSVLDTTKIYARFAVR